MDLPAFNDDGDLPAGVHRDGLKDVLLRFGQGSEHRLDVADRLTRAFRAARSTGKLARFVVFGSFVTSKANPNDVDLVLIMEDDFDLSIQPEDVGALFRHQEAQSRYGASVFWSKRTSAFGGEQAMIEHWQMRREGGLRGIIEIVGEP
jgi:hypothetical protein